MLAKNSIGYNAVPDLAEPRKLIQICKRAEKAGFDAIDVYKRQPLVCACHASTWVVPGVPAGVDMTLVHPIFSSTFLNIGTR